MGEAKRRGSFKERSENPKGDSWRVEYWTDERLAAFKERMKNELGSYVDKIRNDLFTVRPSKKKKFKKIKTGG